MRQCIFCDAKADTAERIFPDWIGKVITNTEIEVEVVTLTEDGYTSCRNYPAKGAAGQRAKVVCGTCNGGWMSDLQGEAKPLLVPLVAGKPKGLTTVEQLLAAEWAIKTAMVGETVMRYVNAFSQEDRELVRREHRPPLRAGVHAASYAVDEPHATRFFRVVLGTSLDNAPVADVYINTIQIGHLILQVRGTHSFPATDNRALERIAVPNEVEIPLWPPVERCEWPPLNILNEAALQLYATGGNEPPPKPPRSG